MSFDPAVVVHLLTKRFGTNDERDPTRDESKLAIRLAFILNNYSNILFDDDECVELENEIDEYENFNEPGEDWDEQQAKLVKDLEEVEGNWTIGGKTATTDQVLKAWNFYTFNGSENMRRDISSVHHTFR